jgi:hypothetical protein
LVTQTTKSEIDQFDAVVVYEHVLKFDIAMHDILIVNISDSPDEL